MKRFSLILTILGILSLATAAVTGTARDEVAASNAVTPAGECPAMAASDGFEAAVAASRCPAMTGCPAVRAAIAAMAAGECPAMNGCHEAARVRKAIDTEVETAEKPVTVVALHLR